MPKNKKLESSSGSGSGSDSDSSGPEDRTPVVKKARTEASSAKPESTPAKTSNASSSSSRCKKSSNGDSVWELEKNKNVTVRAFKGKTYVDIREFYEQGGELKPGKKGISLTVDQWKMLKDIIPEVDDAVKNM